MSREILLNPPRLIDVDQRVKYGTIQALTGMAEIAFADLVKLASQIVSQDDPAVHLSNHHRALMLAWSIVDQADLLRHLITSEEDRIDLPEKTQFLAAVSQVQQARNWMRHIPQRVSAYRARKEQLPPVLGALSFTTVVRANIDLEAGTVVDKRDVIEFHTIVLLNTAFERASRLHGEPVPFDKFQVPIDHVVLQAFGILLPLGDIVTLMSSFCDALAVGVKAWFDVKVAELRSSGADVTTLIKPAYDAPHTYRMVAKKD